MLEFFLSDYNLYYSIAISFVVILSLVEGLGLLLGFSLMSVLDQFTPIDIDADVDLSSGGLTAFIGWLCLHRLPLLIWLVIVLSSFGICGVSLNYLSLVMLDTTLSAYVIFIPSFLFAIFFVKLIAKPLSNLLPKNETSAISNHSFCGLVGKITIGKATYKNPAEAVIHDSFAQKHYILVAPESTDIVLEAGTEIVLVEKLEQYWLAIPLNSNMTQE